MVGALAKAASASATPLPGWPTKLSAASAALLRWRTAAEQEHAHVVAKNNLAGQAFAALSRVPSHGTPRPAEASLAGYAAKAVDDRLPQPADNANAYSAGRAVVPTPSPKAASLSFAVYPNPAYFNETVVVKAPTGRVVQLLDARGQLLTSAVVDAAGQAAFAVAKFEPGFYIVRCGRQSTKLTLR